MHGTPFQLVGKNLWDLVSNVSKTPVQRGSEKKWERPKQNADTKSFALGKDMKEEKKTDENPTKHHLI